MNSLVEKIRFLSKGLGNVTIMEVCGGHTNVVMRYGIRNILPKNIRLVSGPGCPVCVTAQKDIDSAVKLALSGVAVATYGDMLRVPGTKMSLEEARSTGAKVIDVLSAADMPEVAKKQKGKDIVFFGIGFETTTPMTAYLLENNICTYSTHKIMLPAMKALLKGDLKIDGFIDPGHVSTITGSRMWDELKVPQAISGFTPQQILLAVYAILKMIKNKEIKVVNCYDSAVRINGNLKAKKTIEKNMDISDASWRGLGQIKNSGLEPKDENLNAKIIFKDILKNVKSTDEAKTSCRCAEVLKGIIEPKDCALFAKACTPESPKGACMVSEEGSCSIAYKYR